MYLTYFWDIYNLSDLSVRNIDYSYIVNLAIFAQLWQLKIKKNIKKACKDGDKIGNEVKRKKLNRENSCCVMRAKYES